ncbi:MAG: metallophosphoesterase family protein [Caldilineaceae bacterium]|nr:metallophosphoesterase family protein [Caldilineaceae bacterium]
MPPELRVRPDDTFTIVQFTDTHFTATEPTDEQTAALMTRILEAERPDLVMLTGDVIDGGRCTDPAEAWRLALSPVVAQELPWAAVFGNHDDEGRLDRAALMAVQQGIPGCLSEPGPGHLSGVGNYVLKVLAAQGDQAVAHLYCLDSHAYSKTGVGKYGWIERDQIAWYLQTARELAEANGGAKLPALAFFHIPLPEYHEVWDYHPCYGVKYEEIAAPFVNSGFFAALHEAGDVLGTFVGHDHINDFVGDLYGIRLCYGRATGYNTYGRAGMARGARVIRLTKGVCAFSTWLRLEGGEVISEQPLHAPEGTRTLSVE